METTECSSRGEYLKKLEELRVAGKNIVSVYTYWYEGAGKRKLIIPGGTGAKAVFDKLNLDQRIKLWFCMQSPVGALPEMEEVTQQYREALQRDFEETGGYTVCEGELEDSVIVIEHE